MSEDEQAIHEVVDTWMNASKSGDLETVLNLMSDDVMFLVPGSAPFGKAQFKAASESMRGMTMKSHAEILELQVTSDWAWIRNRIEMEVTPPGGNSMHRSGYTLTILRKESDGQWRVARDANFVS